MSRRSGLEHGGAWWFQVALPLVLTACRSSATQPERLADPLPAATLAITIHEGDSCLALVESLERATGCHFLVEGGVRDRLQDTRVPLTHTLPVEPKDVWFVAESCFVAAGFGMFLKGQSPVWSIRILEYGSDAGMLEARQAPFVGTDELPAWSRHPAVILRSIVPVVRIDALALQADTKRFGSIGLPGAVEAPSANVLWVSNFAPRVLAFAREIAAIEARLAAESP